MSDSEEAFSTTVRTLESRIEDLESSLEETEEKLKRAERAVKGSEDGWRELVPLVDCEELPLPHLELAFEPSADGWYSYYIMYRIVMRNRDGDVIGVPLGFTRVSGLNSRRPDLKNLPVLDDANIIHDMAHLGLRGFVRFPDEEPHELTPSPVKDHHFKQGSLHRR